MMKTIILPLIFILTSCSTSRFKNQEVTLDTLPAASKETAKEAKVTPKAKSAPGISKKPLALKEVQAKGAETAEAKPLAALPTAPWKEGESLKYRINAIGLDAAEIYVNVDKEKMLRGQRAWHFKVSGKTTGFTTKIYYFDLKAESFLSGEFKSLQFQSASIEGDSKKQILEQYFPDSSKYYVYKNKDNKVEKEESRDFDLKSPYADGVSFFYLVRTLSQGRSIRVLSNHKVKLLKVDQVSSETITLNDKTYECDKMTISYENKQHYLWREKGGSRRILKGQISLSFASGTLVLLNP